MKIPCIFCDIIMESINPKAIAGVCDSCFETEHLTSILKQINLKKVQKKLDKKLRLTKDGELI